MQEKSDAEVRQLAHMVKSVSRDMHKMKAFVRFKSDQSVFEDDKGEVADAANGDTHYTAWFEPEHAITYAIAPFFVKRFTGMTWSILTPHGCLHWNQSTLIESPGISRPEIPVDEFDDFWRAYYRSIFNPARVKEKAMQSEMPKKYWKYLPEAQCIKELTTQAAARVDEMALAQPTDSERVRKMSSKVTQQQDALRKNN